MNLTKLPAFDVQYYEYDKKIEFPIEMYKTPLKIDGLFEPTSINRLSLGYLINLRRKEDSLNCLINLENGIEFIKNEDNYYLIKSLCKQPIYLMVKNLDRQIKIEPGELRQLFNLKPLIDHKILPKKVGKAYDEYTIKISFCKPFEPSVYNVNDLVSPCWIEMKLNRMIDCVL